MAAALGLGEEEFLRRYTRSIGVRRSLNERRTEFGFDCVFLDRTKIPGKAVCGLYQARPSQCRTWPFWAENIESEEAWNATKSRTPCPGMGRGRLYGYVEITVERDRDRKGEPYGAEQ
jgi:Fe-S-cluster containining protein